MSYEIGRLQSQDDVKKLNAMAKSGIQKDSKRLSEIGKYVDFSEVIYPVHNDTIFIARFFEEIIGAVEYDPVNEPGNIWQIYVHPHHRHVGIGGRLLSAAEDSAKALGRKEMSVHSVLKSKNFYKNYGYKPKGMFYRNKLIKKLK